MATPKQRESAKNIIRAIIAASGGEFAGKTKLNKVFYAAHLYYWNRHDGVLSDYPIVRMPKGPAIDDLQIVLDELERDGILRQSIRQIGPYDENIYSLEVNDDVTVSGDALNAIASALEWIKNRSASEVSELSHRRAWEETPNGREMPIYLDILSEDEFDAMKVRQSEILGVLRDAANAS